MTIEQMRSVILAQSKQTFKMGQYDVPIEPFMWWCLENTPYRDKLPQWVPISTIGLKRDGDSQYHNDWIIGAGIDLDRAYDDDLLSLSYDYYYQFQMKYLNYNISILSGSGVIVGTTIFPNFDDVINTPNSIIVIPNCHPKWTSAVMSCCSNGGVVIAAIGGALCHLATVSRESQGRLVLYKDAMNIPSGITVKVDLDNRMITFPLS